MAPERLILSLVEERGAGLECWLPCKRHSSRRYATPA